MKKTLLFIGLSISTLALAQNTGINTTTPKATLDIVANNTDGSTAEGVLIPRLTGDQIKAMTANLTTEQNGMMVYVTTAVTTASTETNNVNFPGYYRFNITSDTTPVKSWVRMEPSGLEKIKNSSNETAWQLIGENDSGQPWKNALDLSWRGYFASNQSSLEYGALANNSIAIGDGALAKDLSPTYGAPDEHGGIIAIGQNANAYYNQGGSFPGAIAIGTNVSAVNSGIAIGNSSSALGKNPDYYATYNNIAIGYASKASGTYSTAIGSSATASGQNALAINNARAIGTASIALGGFSSAKGDASISLLGETVNYNEIALGINFNTDGSATEPTTFSKNDKQLFSIGNGGYSNNKSNALIILRNAKTGIGLPTDATTPANSKPTEMLDVNGNIRSRTISTNTGSATDKVVVANANGVLKSIDRSRFASPYTAGEGITIDNNEISRSGLELITENGNSGWALIGRGQEQAFGNTGFEAVTFTSAWEHQGSNTFGATGRFSFSAGWRNYASGNISTAFGSETRASGNYSTALGRSSTAFGESSFAVGVRAESLGNYSVALGNNVKSVNSSEVVLGRKNFATDNASPTTTETQDDTQLFSIGNGVGTDRSNAIIILSNAKTGIGLTTNATTPANSKPTEMLDVNGNIRSRTILTNTGSATDKVVVSDANGVLKSVDRSGFSEVIGNEVLNASSNGGLVRSGNGTSDDPYTLGLPNSQEKGSTMQWNGNQWKNRRNDVMSANEFYNFIGSGSITDLQCDNTILNRVFITTSGAWHCTRYSKYNDFAWKYYGEIIDSANKPSGLSQVWLPKTLTVRAQGSYGTTTDDYGSIMGFSNDYTTFTEPSTGKIWKVGNAFHLVTIYGLNQPFQ